LGRSRIIAIRAQQDEFLAAISRHEIARPAQERGKTLQRFVAGLVAISVVNVLEMVDIANDQAAGAHSF
jgi:hypothetical protein